MAQHFLLSAKFRDFSWQGLYDLTEEEAYQEFCAIRFAENDGHAFCPHCGCCDAYALKTRRVFKCGACKKQFSATSKTIFADRKLPFKKLLIAIALFAMPSCGLNTVDFSADLNVQYKTAFVLAQKLREFMRKHNEGLELGGAVAVDGSQWGGFIRPKNVRKEPTDHFKVPYTNPKREKYAVAIREKRQNGKVKVFIGHEQKIGPQVVYATIYGGTEVHTDAGAWWNDFEVEYDHHVINHRTQFTSPEACTNTVESFFAHMEKIQQEYGAIAKQQFEGFVFEGAWRLNHAKATRNERFRGLVAAVAMSGESRMRGYWGRY
ncbi:IS1595 family transposase [Marinicauda algicola]|uniref:IS1595 family transposase n=1 Tax=Marinicauda algicola TaxID=2029849 RepID=A0A4S2H1F4_9PROT|nr:IS1595 family transposase [Marinicauda algicola]TGY89253.1 IS1595 family transposase [Marinicauda algicola]